MAKYDATTFKCDRCKRIIHDPTEIAGFKKITVDHNTWDLCPGCFKDFRDGFLTGATFPKETTMRYLAKAS